ncbi:EF-hand [Suillus fuscotomentosus]|uniref:EF-hand n=1 Tax=Suillus fuscotomentosus TaxID=1912939 RepID=A0AAD4HME4_9AGAM|nr:EF-hand [Suillus fuscotomentosus]KAG1900794.1 EF-hand [Suillus fuscotomentosus]
MSYYTPNPPNAYGSIPPSNYTSNPPGAYPPNAYPSNIGRYPSSQPRQYTQQQGLPAGADPQLWQWFCAVDTDRSGALSVTELQDALVNEFDLDTVKMLMNIFVPGTIGFNEFAGLWKYIAEHFDRDHSGSIDGRELAEALRNFGYSLSPPLLRALEIRYASGATSAYGPPPGITFDRFVRACVTVKTLTETFQREDRDNDGWIQLNYEDFLKISLSAP